MTTAVKRRFIKDGGGKKGENPSKQQQLWSYFHFHRRPPPPPILFFLLSECGKEGGRSVGRGFSSSSCSRTRSVHLRNDLPQLGLFLFLVRVSFFFFFSKRRSTEIIYKESSVPSFLHCSIFHPFLGEKQYSQYKKM